MTAAARRVLARVNFDSMTDFAALLKLERKRAVIGNHLAGDEGLYNDSPTCLPGHSIVMSITITWWGSLSPRSARSHEFCELNPRSWFPIQVPMPMDTGIHRLRAGRLCKDFLA